MQDIREAREAYRDDRDLIVNKILMFDDRDIEVSEEFRNWFEVFDPGGWDISYSGDLYGLWMAWEEGRKFGESKRDQV